MVEKLYQWLSENFSISKEDFKSIHKFLKIKKYRKGEFILEEGGMGTVMHFVGKGIVHQYVMIQNQQFTIDIKLQGMAFNALKSYLEETPSKELQEAVTNVILISIEKSNFDILLKSSRFRLMYLKILEDVLLRREDRTLLLQHKSAADRFKIFMETDPNAHRLLLEVPQKLLASYLTMAPETFSKVKKEYFLN